MTIPEFLHRLREEDTQWHLFEDADIRCTEGDCPITRVAQSVVHEPFSPDTWEAAAAALDMEFDDAQAIVDAADLVNDFDQDLRAKLLAATIMKGFKS